MCVLLSFERCTAARMIPRGFATVDYVRGSLPSRAACACLGRRRPATVIDVCACSWIGWEDFEWASPLVAVLLVYLSTTIVPAGHVGVQDFFGSVSDRILVPGINVSLDVSLLFRLQP